MSNIKLMSKYLFFIVFISFFSGCTDLFSTRENQVEKPKGNGIGIFEEATTPETVLINFGRAVENNNTVEYMKVFSNPEEYPEQPYYFYGPAYFETQLDNPPWDYNEESIFATNLLTDNTISSITFDYVDSLPDIRYTNTGNDSLETAETDFFKYKITISQKDFLNNRIFKGQSQIKLFHSRKGSELWYITEWIDEPIDTTASLSSLKLERYQGHF